MSQDQLEKQIDLNLFVCSKSDSEHNLIENLTHLSLQSVLATHELRCRPSRPPDYEAENKVLTSLMHEMAGSPKNILLLLAESALKLCSAHSSGISLLEEEDGGKIFRCHSAAGQWSRYLGGTMPREASPCGTVLDRNAPLLFSHPERHFPIPADVSPAPVEVLLIPFHLADEPIGTIWVIAHDDSRQFDAEDERILTSLGRFASTAYQALASLDALKSQAEARQKAEAATAFLAAIVNHSDDAIISKDLNGVITSWNTGAERLFGYAAQEALGRSVTILIPSEREHEEAEILSRVQRGQPVDHFETVRVRKDRSLVEISLSVSPIKDSKGRIIGASKIARNISERKRRERALAEVQEQLRLHNEALARKVAALKQAEAALRQSEQKFRQQAQLLDLSQDPIIVRDLEHRIRFWSRGAQETYGWAPSEGLGQVAHELLHTQFPLPLETITTQVLRDGFWRGELVQQCRDQQRVVVDSRWTMQRDENDRAVAILMINRDITERKRDQESLRELAHDLQEAQTKLQQHANELERRVQERTSDLAAANEHLNNEIVERCRAQATREGLMRQFVNALEEERRRVSRELHDQTGQHLTALSLGLKQLQDAVRNQRKGKKILARLEKLANDMGERLHRIAFELRPTALDDVGLISTLRNHLRSWSERFQIEADFQTSGFDGAGISREAETALYRTVQEALNNVVKHAQASHVSVVLERLDDNVQVVVEDNGRGLDAEQTVDSHSQTGRLGLLGMKERLGLLRGALSIESTPGAGTTVFVRIPIPNGQQTRQDPHPAGG